MRPWKETVRPEVGHWCWNGKRRRIRDVREVDSVSLGALLGAGREGDEGVKYSCCMCGEVVGALRKGRSQEKGVWLGQSSGCPLGVVRWHWGSGRPWEQDLQGWELLTWTGSARCAVR